MPPVPPPKTRDDDQDAQLKRMQKALDEQEKWRKQHEKEDQARDKKVNAMAILGAMTARVDETMTDLRAAATLLGTAYSKAAKQHRVAVAAQNQLNALDEQLMFAVLSVFAAGAFSWVTEATKAMQAARALKAATKAQKVLETVEASERRLQEYWLNYTAEKLKLSPRSAFVKLASTEVKPRSLDRLITVTGSTLSAGVGSVFSLAPSFITPPATEPVSEEPLEFQNNLVTRLDTVQLTIQKSLRELAEKIRDTKPDAWDKYKDDEFQTAFQKWQKDVSEFAGKADLPSEQDMTDEMERFIWAAWMPALMRTEIDPGGCAPVDGPSACWDESEVTVYERVRKPVNDRFVALGIETEEQTDWKRQKEDPMLVAWAEKYRETAKPLVTGRAKRAK